jgi:hypothetical protein
VLLAQLPLLVELVVPKVAIIQQDLLRQVVPILVFGMYQHHFGQRVVVEVVLLILVSVLKMVVLEVAVVNFNLAQVQEV